MLDPLTVESSTDDVLVLRLSGQFTGAAGESELVLDAMSALPPPRTVVLDLDGLSLITVDGARALRALTQVLDGRGLRVRFVLAPDSAARPGLVLAGVDEDKALVASTELAIASFTDPERDTAGPDALVEQFAALTRALLDADTVGAVLRQVVVAAVVMVPGADLASVTLRAADGGVSTPAQTGDTADELDQIQYASGDGPCLEAARPDGPAFAISSDLAREDRWASFTAAARGYGVAAVLATDLLPAGGPAALTGALNIYSRRPYAFEADHARHIALLLATHASLALAQAHTLELATIERTHLRHAIDTRDVIGQAKGILMARQRLTPDQAFDLLRAMSQNLNVKLVDLARRLVQHRTELDP